MPTELATLTAKLAVREEVIERGLQTFVEVGQALAEIRDQKLYRGEFGTFEEYCSQRWQLARTRAYELISASETAKGMSEISDKYTPKNEGQAKQLRGLNPEMAVEVMREAESNTDGKVTAAAIKDARERLENPASEPPAGDNGIVEVACNICDRFFPIQETYEAVGGGFECEDCVQPAVTYPVDSAPEPVDDRRVFLAPAFKKKVTEIMKAVESLRKKIDDDRFGYNAPGMSQDNLPELIRARQDLDFVIEALQVNWKGSEL